MIKINEQQKRLESIIIKNTERYVDYDDDDTCPFESRRVADPDELAKKILKAGYHKTIWHKVADGDLPKNANYVLVAYHYYSIVSYAIACYKCQLSNSFRKWSTTDDYFKHDDDVIAWTELPEYKE